MIDEPKKASAPSALDPTLRRGTITGHRHHHRTNSEPSLQTAAEIVTRVRIKRIRFYRNSQDDIYPSPCTSSEFSFKYYCNALHRISTESYLTEFTAFVSAPFSNSNWTIDKWLKYAAFIKGVKPFCKTQTWSADHTQEWYGVEKQPSKSIKLRIHSLLLYLLTLIRPNHIHCRWSGIAIVIRVKQQRGGSSSNHSMAYFVCCVDLCPLGYQVTGGV